MVSPLGVDRVRDHMAKERPYFGACDEVTTPSGTAASGVETMHRVIEREFYDLAIEDWALAPDLLPDDFVKRGDQIAQVQPPPTRSVTSETVFTMPGKMPNTRVAKTVRPNAA